MGKKTLIIFLALFLSVLNQGCVAKNRVGATGFSYIFQESRTLTEQAFHNTGAGKTGDSGETGSGGKTGNGDETGSSEIDESPFPGPGEAAGEKKVYLTFDDGPDSVVTTLILDILDHYAIKATFFVVGTEIEKNPGMLRDIARRGHSLGNHTYNHRYQDIYSGRDSFLESIKKNEELIFSITGQRPKIVRDPGGAVRKSGYMQDSLAESGYRLVDWNVESYDSRKPSLTAPEIIEKVRQQTRKKELWPHMVIIMHDGRGHMATARALPTIIDMLQNQGFQFAAF